MSSRLKPKKPCAPVFVPGDGPVDAEYVGSLWLEACIEGKHEIAEYLLTICEGLRGVVHQNPRSWDLATVLKELHETFGEGRSFGLMENIVFSMDERGECFRGSLVAMEMVLAVIRQMVVAVSPGEDPHHGRQDLH